MPKNGEVSLYFRVSNPFISKSTIPFSTAKLLDSTIKICFFAQSILKNTLKKFIYAIRPMFRGVRCQILIRRASGTLNTLPIALMRKIYKTFMIMSLR